MSKDERLYARFDIGMDEHPKIMLLSDAAFRALIESTLYARRQLTDGFLNEGIALKKWGAGVAAELSSNDPERPSWTRVDGGWRIHDFEKHQTTNADIAAKREAGRKGGLAKAKRTASKQVAPATNPLEQKGSNSLAKTETDTETTKKKSIVQDKPALASEFASFWTLYPRKQGKADALKAFTSARKKTPAKTIIDGAQAYALLNIGEDKSFLKLPGGWIRGERWEDEQIVNATKHTSTEQPAECPFHAGYPLPCLRCAEEGREF